jgi:hypothetical protein
MSTTQKWLLLLYVCLLLSCATMIFASELLNPVVRQAILPIATDGFKTVLGALLGALSVLMGTKTARSDH